MSTDSNAASAATNPTPAAPTAPAAEPKPTPPAPKETDWKAEARKHEDRAKEWKQKAEANEEAARRLAEIEAANQTELEKAMKRADEAEARYKALEVRALRAEVAAEKGVPVELLSGETKDEIEAVAERLIEFKGTKPPVGVRVPNQDKTPPTTTSGLAETARKLFGG